MASRESKMLGFKTLTLWLLLALGVASSLSGCALERRQDGGVTLRPIHWY
jgi:hypothetical protein